MEQNKKRMSGLLSSTFAFLLTLLFMVLIVCLGFNVGAFSNRVIIRIVNQSNYYNEVYENVSEEAEQIIKQAGLPTTVLQEVITLERVYIGGKYYIEKTLLGEEPEVDTSKMKEALRNNIDGYLTEEEIVRTEELSNGVELVVSEVEKLYIQGVQFRFIHYLTELRSSYVVVLNVILPVSLLLIGILCYFLIKLQKYKHRGLRYIIYAAIASSAITIIGSSTLLLNHWYNRTQASPEYYRNFLISYLRWDIKVFLNLGLIGALISVILIMVHNYIKIKVKNN